MWTHAILKEIGWEGEVVAMVVVAGMFGGGPVERKQKKRENGKKCSEKLGVWKKDIIKKEWEKKENRGEEI